MAATATQSSTATLAMRSTRTLDFDSEPSLIPPMSVASRLEEIRAQSTYSVRRQIPIVVDRHDLDVDHTVVNKTM
jgi:hypothetical protein